MDDAQSAQTVVQSMLAAWSPMDIAKIADFFTEDAVYVNVPTSTVRGQAELRASLAQIEQVSSAHAFEILKVAAAGGLVFAERIDRYEIAGQPFAPPVVGVFEVRGGKIAAWRDYFDREMAVVGLLSP